MPLNIFLLSLITLMPLAPVLAASEVILVRHGDKDSVRGDYNLSPAGFQRSMALARLIPACFGAPTAITTYYLDPDTSKNARSYQSAVPLGVATGVNIRIALTSRDDSYAVGQQLRRRAGSPSERVVLFWEHRRMPELARGLGWPAMPPIPDDDFDQLIVFRFGAPGAVPEVSRMRQNDLLQQPCYQQAAAISSQVGAGSAARPAPVPGRGGWGVVAVETSGQATQALCKPSGAQAVPAAGNGLFLPVGPCHLVCRSGGAAGSPRAGAARAPVAGGQPWGCQPGDVRRALSLRCGSRVTARHGGGGPDSAECCLAQLSG